MTQVIRELNIPLGIVVSRAEIGYWKAYDYCEKEKITVLLETPFDKKNRRALFQWNNLHCLDVQVEKKLRQAAS